MKFTLSWLKTYLDTDASLQEISEKLTSIGLEVEEIVDNSAALAPFIAAEILDAQPHPNADKLRLCKVNNGTETLQIVCGAPNARTGIKVVLAQVGTVIPTNGLKIKPSKIRDVESNGMLCSAAELGIAEDAQGIVELPENAALGQPFASALGLDDPVIEIAITPNRGDCLGVYGIARDLAAAGLGTLKPVENTPVKGNFASPIKVTIDTPEKAPRFVGRTIKGVKNAESPAWLKQRLESIGLKPISALVDITNFLTFDLGRPAHVYDAAKLKGDLKVRDAREGEALVALNDREYTLEAGMTVIADDSGAVALGGIIGGEPTGCDENTTDVFLEIALFNPINVAVAGRKLQLNTDARYRFERNVDPAFLTSGAEIATRLILELCGGEASELVIAGEEPKAREVIDFRPARVEQLVGITPTEKEMLTILGTLGCICKKSGDVVKVQVPSWRSDIEQEADVIEEVARLYGYDAIPRVALSGGMSVQAAINADQRRLQDMRRVLAGRGMKEAVTFSFISSEIAAMFDPANDNITLANPISAELDVMRLSIFPHLLQAVSRNQARGVKRAALFEIGPVFSRDYNLQQQNAAAGVRCGQYVSQSHYGDNREVDVFDAKADALAALSLYLPVDNLNISREAPSWYHPGRSGAIMLGKNIIGYFGELHPSLLRKLDIKTTVVGFELFPENAPKAKPRKSTAFPAFERVNLQPVERDFAFIVDENTEAEAVLRAVRKADKQLIESVTLFDVYSGKGIEQGKKSLALTVTLQPKEQTLNEEALERISQLIIQSVQKDTNAILRDGSAGGGA